MGTTMMDGTSRSMARRSLGGSMTIVGDIAQATGPWAPTQWNDVLAHFPSNWNNEQVELTIGYRTPAEAMAIASNVLRETKLGLTLAPAARVSGAGAEGVVVTGVDSGGVAADHGFATGDVIVEIAGKSVSTPADVRDVVTSARTEGKRSVLVRVKKGDNVRFVALPLGRG